MSSGMINPIRIRKTVGSRESSPRDEISNLEDVRGIKSKIDEMQSKIDELKLKIDELILDRTSSPRALAISRAETTTKNTQLILESMKVQSRVIVNIYNKLLEIDLKINDYVEESDGDSL